MINRSDTNTSKNELLAKIESQGEIICELLIRNEELRLRLWLTQQSTPEHRSG